MISIFPCVSTGSLNGDSPNWSYWSSHASGLIWYSLYVPQYARMAKSTQRRVLPLRNFAASAKISAAVLDSVPLSSCAATPGHPACSNAKR